ncbi:MAG: carbonic anhydrase [Pseudomonadota bacterium]
MKYCKVLPKKLIQNYQQWQAQSYQPKQDLFHQLSGAQSPEYMVISCCDSRVFASHILGESYTGEFFVHRNIANVVAPWKADALYGGTSAAIEFALKVLKVRGVIVMGHSNCGGVAYYDQCAHQDKNNFEFLDDWLKILSPAYQKVEPMKEKQERLNSFEKENILLSLHNIASFPFAKTLLENNKLTLYGLWHDIKNGQLSYYNAESASFEIL